MKRLPDATIAHLREVAERPDFSGTRYTLVREIARGGMGVIYEAEDQELQRTVALKVVSSEIAGPESVERLRAEARIIAQLEHPGIVPVHDAGELPDGRAWYAMKFVRGKTLREVMEGAAAASDLLRIFLRVCETVAFAHAHGVIHRDLKPDNVMVGAFGEVLIMDWGVGAVGTHGFMAPEQQRGTVDSRTDVFALGKMLAHLGRAAAGRPLRAIVDKATRADPGDRYQDAGGVAADVVRFLDGERVLAHRETVLEKLTRWLRRHRALVALVAAYIVMRVLVYLWVRV